jgi:N-acetylneuraminate synthase
MRPGDTFTPENLRSVRPGHGLHTRYYELLLGRKINMSARKGTPMAWDLIG